ncbi:hypothetical protein KC953_02075 [Candidatus Saccharibacteria bacterium]|nr:hypothetical protein [Candidatus Saccharibacteria bacterium]
MKSTNKQKTNVKKFENNPFYITTNGITLLAESAQGIFFLFIGLAILNFLMNDSPEPSQPAFESMTATLQTWTASEWLLIGGSVSIIIFAMFMIYTLFEGVAAYTSVQLARNKTVAVREAFRVAFEHLWAFFWLRIIVFTKVLLWSLLVVIPGIIMAIKYSLAGAAFFDPDKNLRGNAAVQESIRMTKNAWITTFAANALFNIMTLGAISTLVSTSVNSILYRQYADSGDTKPNAHWLSWVTLFSPLLLVGLLIILIIGLVAAGVILQAPFNSLFEKN